MKTLNTLELNRWKQYKVPSGTEIQRVKLDVVHFNKQNTLRHELAKALASIQLMFYGEITFNEKVKEALKLIESESIRTKNDSHHIITEAQELNTGLRRDLVDISGGGNHGEIYEFELERRRAIRHNKIINAITLY